MSVFHDWPFPHMYFAKNVAYFPFNSWLSFQRLCRLLWGYSNWPTRRQRPSTGPEAHSDICIFVTVFRGPCLAERSEDWEIWFCNRANSTTEGQKKFTPLRFSENISPMADNYWLKYYTPTTCSYLCKTIKFYSTISNFDRVMQSKQRSSIKFLHFNRKIVKNRAIFKSVWSISAKNGRMTQNMPLKHGGYELHFLKSSMVVSHHLENI